MAVVHLPTRSSRRWASAVATLDAALVQADHPRLLEHAASAEEILSEAGRPTNTWANRIAAIAVIASRRADAAPTMRRRAAYVEVAAGAADLLLLADLIHSTQPDPSAARVVSELPAIRRSALR